MLIIFLTISEGSVAQYESVFKIPFPQQYHAIDSIIDILTERDTANSLKIIGQMGKVAEQSNNELILLNFKRSVLDFKYIHSHDLHDTIYLNETVVEIAPGIGLADAIVDLVSSGSTLLANGLKEVETILHSQAVLVQNNNIPAAQQSLLQKLLFRIRAVKKAKNNKYILLNAPNDNLHTIISLLPGMKSPTVLPLAEPGWSSVHSVLSENEFWEIIEKLKEAGVASCETL